MSRQIVGHVSSDKADKTIVVTVHTRKTHPLYRKAYSVTKKFMAHDEQNEAKHGDQVLIAETRPLSKNKRYTLVKVLETARILHEEPEPANVKEEVEVAEPKAAKPARKSGARAAKETDV